MRKLSIALVFLLVGPARAQVQSDTNVHIAIAEDKFVALAGALSEENYTWRPAEGVRSVAEVLSHVAGTNYWMMTLLGCNPPSESSITRAYSSVVEFEKRTDRAAISASMAPSFAHLKECVAAVPDDKLDVALNMFGTPGNGRSYLLLTLAHLHEHLGQLVAYTRSNDVIPPWSR